MNYNVTLVAGCRRNGAKQFGSVAEELDAKQSFAWLQSTYTEQIIKLYPRFNSATLDLTEEEAAELLKDYRVLDVVKPLPLTLHKITQAPAPAHLMQISGETAGYTYDTDGEDIIVAVFDSGVDTTHSDFEYRAMEVFDVYGGIPLDSSHGTHVAGLIGGKTYGVAKKSLIISLRVMLDAGGEDSGIIEGIDWLLENRDITRPMVANFSLGGPVGVGSEFLEDAILAMITDGIIVCVAAGNENEDASGHTPARLAEAITVGAVTANNVLTSFTNFGSCVDILAPGANITSTGLDNTTLVLSGTSMATPIVSGVVARIVSRQPDLNQEQVLDILTTYCQSTVAKLLPDVDYTETNALLPPEQQIPSKFYSTTTRKLLSSNIPGVIETNDIATLPGINPLSNVAIIPYVIIDGVKEYGVPRTLTTTVGPAIVTYNGTKAVKQVGMASLLPAMAPGTQPRMTPMALNDNNRYIAISLDPSLLLDYSVQLGMSSGTFNFNTLGTVPGIKSTINIQGINGVIERIGREVSRSSAGVRVEGRLLPLYTQEQVCINLQARLDFRPYTLLDVVNAIASQAGTTVSVGTSGLLYDSYTYTGRFIEALDSLAKDAGGSLVQQNGKWYILPFQGYTGAFDIPMDDLISVSIEQQADIKDAISGLVQTRKSIDQALITNVRDRYGLNLSLLSAERELLPSAMSNTSYTAVSTGFSSISNGSFINAGGSIGLLAYNTKANGKQITLSSLLKPMASGGSGSGSGATTAANTVPATTTVKLGPLKFEFGKKGNWQVIDGNVLIEAPPWSWHYWLVKDDEMNKKYSNGIFPSEYYQIKNAPNDSYGRPQKMGLKEVDIYSEILIEVSLPHPNCYLTAAGKLENLDVNGGGWINLDGWPTHMPFTMRTTFKKGPGGTGTWETKYYISFYATGERSIYKQDTNLYSANLDIWYTVFNEQPLQIDGLLTPDQYVLDSQTNEVIAKVENNTVYEIYKPSLGVLDAATGRIYNTNDAYVAYLSSDDKVKSPDGRELGMYNRTTAIDAPVFGGNAQIKGYEILDSVGNKIGDVVSNSKALMRLESKQVPAISDSTGTVLAYVNNKDQLVTKYNNRIIGDWTVSGVPDTVDVQGTEAVVGGKTGSEVFGLPIGTKIGTVSDIEVKTVSNVLAGAIRGNDVYAGNGTGTQIGQIAYTGDVVTTGGKTVAQLRGNELNSVGTEGYTAFNLPVGPAGGVLAYVMDKPNGLYNTAGNLVASVAGTTVRSANGTPLGSIKESGVITDGAKPIANVNDAGQIISSNGQPIGDMSPSPDGGQWIYNSGEIIGKLKPTTTPYLTNATGTSGSTANDILNPAIDANGNVISIVGNTGYSAGSSSTGTGYDAYAAEKAAEIAAAAAAGGGGSGGTGGSGIGGSGKNDGIGDGIDGAIVPVLDDIMYVPNSIADGTATAVNAADSLARLTAAQKEVDSIENQILGNEAEGQLLGANKAVVDEKLSEYGANSILPTLDQIAVVNKQLEDIKATTLPSTDPLFGLTPASLGLSPGTGTDAIVSTNPAAQALINSAATNTFAAEQAKQAMIQQLQTELTGLENSLLSQIAGLTVHEEVIACSFIYDNILPLAGNYLTVGGGFNTGGIINSISFNGSTVTANARRLVL